MTSPPRPWALSSLSALSLLLALVPALAAEQSTERLAKETQNPVANLISVPFQNDFNFGAGTRLAVALPVPVPLPAVTGGS